MTPGFRRLLGFVLMPAALAGCSKEARTLASTQPQTVPAGPADPRTPRYQANAWQISQGSRYFTWYGCGGCHGGGAQGVLDLGDGRWRHGGAVDQVYGSIARGHGSLGARIPVEQLWQITAYVRDLTNVDPVRRRRQDLDQQGEPQGTAWAGPVR